MAGLRLAKGVIFLMHVQHEKKKKEIGKGWIYNITLVDADEKKYTVEYCSPTPENKVFIVGTSVYFEVEFANDWTDEIMPAKMQASAQIVGVPPPSFAPIQPPTQNAINSNFDEPFVPEPGPMPVGKNRLIALQFAKDIFVAATRTGYEAVEEGGKPKLDVLFEMSDKIEAYLNLGSSK